MLKIYRVRKLGCSILCCISAFAIIVPSCISRRQHAAVEHILHKRNINSSAAVNRSTLHLLPAILSTDKCDLMSNITQVVNVDKNLTSLKKSVHATDLDQVLSSTGPFTLFAPSDVAFSKLDKGVLEDLLKPQNKAKLTDLVNLHVVAGKVEFKDLKDGEKLKTVEGKVLAVHVKDGHVTVGDALIGNHDLQTSNGVIHSVDKVLTKN